MLAQIHFNFGPTAFDRIYQLSLPLVPGGVFTGGLLLARPGLGLSLRNAITINPYLGVTAVAFTAYLTGFLFFGISAMVTSVVSGVTEGLVFRAWMPLRASYSLSQCTIWRQVAAKFLGELAPALPENPVPTSVIEKVMRPMKELTERRQLDELWEEWYRILQDYLLRGTPLISNEIMLVWLTAHATAWALFVLSFIDPQVRYWWIYVPTLILIFFGSLFPFLITFSYVSSERLTYWDFTARLLAEIRGRPLSAADTVEKKPLEGA
jgi:hypothetical protein